LKNGSGFTILRDNDGAMDFIDLVHFHGQRLTMDDSDLNALTGFGTHYRRFNGTDYRRQGLFSGLKK
jgi:hypothetical protein